MKEQLEKGNTMLVDPAELVMLNEDVSPHYTGWAREIPVHYLDKAKQLISNLLEAGVISEVKRPVAWCTQGFFVSKPSSGKLRLVTDYRNLNKALARPEWPFLPSDQVRKRIDPKARVFGAFDLTSGYHQVKLTESD